ncbi:MAG TPA: putative nucleotidyltransferase substrate binding domain-containing protein [Burkholderiales bacterium]|nr:putative nucleotidyltransferase substrate binding domain-containing protein [Burkholderiales bacterium]
MPHEFNFDASPFDVLSATERERVRASAQVARFAQGATILEQGAKPTQLFVIAQGYVRQFEGEEAVAVLGPQDCFDGRGLVAGKASSRFVAAEDVVLHQLPGQVVNELISANATFGALLFSDLSEKLGALSGRGGRHELQSLMSARVRDAQLRPANIVDARTDVLAVVRMFSARGVTNTLVRDAAAGPVRLGIFTTTNLQRAILDGRPLARLAVGELASFPLVTVGPGDHLFEALALMIRHRVHRVVVEEGGQPSGILEQLDLLGFLSNHSYLIALRIMEAGDLAVLEQAALQIDGAVARLYRGGAKLALLTRLVQELNAKLYARAWQLVAPAELVANSCLFVMGSEGRGEQLLKTDQDNGLVLRDGYAAPPDLDTICKRFSDALSRFGYPECPGGVMLSNPTWRQPLHGFVRSLERWLLPGESEGLVALSTLLDARAVCGDAALLEALRDEIFARVAEGDAQLRRFASAIDAFAEGGGWLSRLLHPRGGEIDLKKAAIFPLVHGVRSLALERHVRASGTVDRIEALVGAGRLSREAGTELNDALHILLELRLKAALAQIELGHAASGSVSPEQLTSLDRALLNDALAAVRRLRSMLRYHFRLDAV